jgi:DNA-directed RNA polymerase subunit RPC12/RpoP
LGLAALVLVGALVAYYAFAVASDALYWTLLGLVVLVLLVEAVLHLLPAGARSARAAVGPGADAGFAPTYDGSAPAPRPAPRTLTLRCGDCGTVFDLTDTGERPLYHACPGCGAEGVMRDPAPAPAQDEPPEAYAPPAERLASQQAAAPLAVKRMKLRCGGCKEVFSIEDTGERPLRRPCPYCARMGEVK